MKILHVITSLRTGGAEKLMSILLPKLRDLGNDVELLLFDGTRTPIYDEIINKGIKVYSLGVGTNVYSPTNIYKLRKYIGHYDIIHTHNTACQLFVPIAKSCNLGGAKLVTTEHNSTNRRRNKPYLKIIDNWMYSQYSHIICIADKTKRNLTEYIGKSQKTSVICNGIELSNYVSIPIKEFDTDKQIIITMVSAFRKQKNQECLINALARLPKNYIVRLIGDGERKQDMEKYVARLNLTDRVDFMGIQTDIARLLEESDINVLSSHWEGLSLSSLECMASGRPFIASDVDGLHEIVDGHGILFPDGDDKKLADAILSTTSDPRHYKEIANKCREKAEQYSISTTAEKYNNVYLEITK